MEFYSADIEILMSGWKTLYFEAVWIPTTAAGQRKGSSAIT
jgi:hypothetical protein